MLLKLCKAGGSNDYHLCKIIIISTMNNIFKGLLAGSGAKKLGGG